MTWTREAIEDYTAGVLKARESYAKDGLMASRGAEVAHLEYLHRWGHMTREQYREDYMDIQLRYPRGTT